MKKRGYMNEPDYIDFSNSVKNASVRKPSVSDKVVDFVSVLMSLAVIGIFLVIILLAFGNQILELAYTASGWVLNTIKGIFN